MTRYTEIVDSVESLKEFLDMNKITPSEIIVIWDEDDYLSTDSAPSDEERVIIKNSQGGKHEN